MVCVRDRIWGRHRDGPSYRLAPPDAQPVLLWQSHLSIYLGRGQYRTGGLLLRRFLGERFSSISTSPSHHSARFDPELRVRFGPFEISILVSTGASVRDYIVVIPACVSLSCPGRKPCAVSRPHHSTDRRLRRTSTRLVAS